MPDWSYRTVFQPLLFRLPFETARSLALGSMGRLARLPGGKTVIDLMGHMAPDDRLRTDIAGRTVAAPLMLGCHVDPHLTALPALARFGFGLIEVGPVGLTERTSDGQPRLDVVSETIIVPADEDAVSVNLAADAIVRSGVSSDHIIVRLAEPDTDDASTAIDSFQRVIAALPPIAAVSLPLSVISTPEVAERIVTSLVPTLTKRNARLFVVAGTDRSEGEVVGLVESAIKAGADGIIIDATRETANGDVARGQDCREAARQLTRSLRAKLGDEIPIITGGGVHEPLDAVRLIQDGATMVQVDSGLIFTGPGLPKRINDALLCLRVQSRVESPESRVAGDLETLIPRSSTLNLTRPGRQSWLWTLLMGVAMLIGGVMAMVIAVTKVVMPYDEQFVGMTRSELAALNDQLLAFMTHDRVTLAGTMLAVGVLYTLHSWYGIRRGWHWAQWSVVASAFIGFFTFFTFLGFGYFDPLHAFVTVVLFQFLLLGVHSDMPRPAYDDVPNLTNHAAWRRALWGQLAFVVQGALLITAGCVICGYGMTSVFVPEDLEFMQTTAEALCAANPQLVPLVAHDRATFGGMLIACGVTVLLSALWGYRQGNAWLWWGLFTGGNVAYLATILVHWHVGYTSLKHLLPAYGGLLLVWIGSTLSRRFLCEIDRSDAGHWREAIGST